MLTLSTIAPPVHPVLQAMADVEAALEQAAGLPTFAMSASETLQLLEAADRLVRRASAVRLDAVRLVDARGAAADVGATDTRAWLRASLQERPSVAHRTVLLARALDGRYAATHEALSSTEVNSDQAEVIVRVLDGLPPSVDSTVRAEAEMFLLEQARAHDAQALGRLGRHLGHVLDPDGGDKLERLEQSSVGRREFTLSPDEHGMRLRGWLEDEAAAALLTAIDALAKPRPSSAEGPDLRTPGRRRADGLVELVNRVLDGGLLSTQRGERPHVSITVGLDSLEGRLAATGAELDRGVPLSAAAARRLACDARVIPVVLGAQSEPLDVGRASYTVPTPMRRALVARDRGCAFPCCDRPAAWADAHHIRHWVDGGDTALDNLVLLCGHHHRLVHHRGWTVAIGDDGLPVFTPPPWLNADPTFITPWRRSLERLARQQSRGP